MHFFHVFKIVLKPLVKCFLSCKRKNLFWSVLKLLLLWMPNNQDKILLNPWNIILLWFIVCSCRRSQNRYWRCMSCGRRSMRRRRWSRSWQRCPSQNYNPCSSKDNKDIPKCNKTIESEPLPLWILTFLNWNYI